MSESYTMFNEWDRRCAAIQLMLSTDPSYDNRTIASNLKMQIRTVQCLRAQLNTLDNFLEVVERKATSCHFTSSKSAGKSTPKCTWMCWRCGDLLVQSGGRWQTLGVAAGLGAGPQVQRDPGLASEGVLWFCTLLSVAPSSPDLNLLDYFVWSYIENITNMTFYNTIASLIATICRVFTKLPPALVEKACSQFWMCIEAVIEAEGGYIE